VRLVAQEWARERTGAGNLRFGIYDLRVKGMGGQFQVSSFQFQGPVEKVSGQLSVGDRRQ
jgi:hypothetical protein